MQINGQCAYGLVQEGWLRTAGSKLEDCCQQSAGKRASQQRLQQFQGSGMKSAEGTDGRTDRWTDGWGHTHREKERVYPIGETAEVELDCKNL